MNKITQLTTILTIATILSSCGTIMHGTTADIGISSNPSGAKVCVDGQEKGKTPIIAELKRKNSHTISVEMPGYEPYSATVTNSVSGWVWGNLLAGGLIGLAVDAISGGLYTLDPEQVQAQLMRTGSRRLAANTNQKGLLMFVTLKPDKKWKKVGQLTPAKSK